MPGYSGKGLAALIYDNQQAYFFNGETVPAETASVAYQVAKITGLQHSFSGFSVEASFAGAPGAFEIDVQGADTDDPAFYVSIGTINAVSATNVGRFSQAGVPVKYVRVFLVSLTNAVVLTAKLTR